MTDIMVRVKPGSKKGPLVQPSLTGDLLIYVREPATDNKANNAVVELIADYYDVSRTSVSILRGHTSRTKFVRIDTGYKK